MLVYTYCKRSAPPTSRRVMHHNVALYLTYILLVGAVIGLFVISGMRLNEKNYERASSSFGAAFIYAGILWQFMLFTTSDGSLTNVSYGIFMIPFWVGLVFTMPLAFKKMVAWRRGPGLR